MRVILDGKEVTALSKNKKVLIGAVLVAVLLVGSVGGVVLAADNGGDDGSDGRLSSHFDRVCELYQEKTGVALDVDALKESLAEARSEMCENAPERLEKAPGMRGEDTDSGDRVHPTMQDRLQNLIEEGKITQEQADEYQQWWDSKPDIGAGFGFRGHRGTFAPPASPPAE
jgi:hypothetical protein